MFIINCPIKNIYIYTLKLYNHPAETHRLLKFLFHIMGRLVPAHNKLAHSNSRLSTEPNEEEIFPNSQWLDNLKIIFILFIFCCVGIHHTDSKMTAMKISKKYTISPYGTPL